MLFFCIIPNDCVILSEALAQPKDLVYANALLDVSTSLNMTGGGITNVFVRVILSEALAQPKDPLWLPRQRQ